MSTTVCCAPTIPLHRPWWQRLADALREARARARAPDPWRELRHLDAQTLKDLGAPPALYQDELRAWRDAGRGFDR